MREIERIDRISDKLSDLWHNHPDQRLGQLLENYVFGYIVPSPLFHVEDDEIENRIDAQIKISNKNDEENDDVYKKK